MEQDYDDEVVTAQDIDEAFSKVKINNYNETMQELQKQKLKLEIAKLKEKPLFSRADKEFLLGASCVLAGNMLGDNSKW